MERKVNIEIADVNDSRSIYKVLNSSFEEFKPNYTPRAFLATVISIRDIENRIKTGVVWIATINKEILGTISGTNVDGSFYIQGLAVLPKARNREIGSLLLKLAEDFAIENEYVDLVLNTTPYLKAAINLYERIGFGIINEPPYDLHGTPLFSMKKVL